jgi:hypothetical protein
LGSFQTQCYTYFPKTSKKVFCYYIWPRLDRLGSEPLFTDAQTHWRNVCANCRGLNSQYSHSCFRKEALLVLSTLVAFKQHVSSMPVLLLVVQHDFTCSLRKESLSQRSLILAVSNVGSETAFLRLTQLRKIILALKKKRKMSRTQHRKVFQIEIVPQKLQILRRFRCSVL